jgi:4-hydroxyacetophenone monooxygenase
MNMQETFELGRRELIEASDAVIDDAVEHVDPIVLRGLLYLLTGDEQVAALPHSLMSMGLLGNASVISDPRHVGLLRAKAAAFLKSYRDAGAGDYPLARERLHRSLELAAGEAIAEAELEMWVEQLAIDPMARGFAWPASPAPERREEFHVAVIGGGMGGLNAAVHLKQAGIPFTLIEKNSGVGGTWHENRYPGARLDTTSRSYFHTFGVDFPCPAPYSIQAHNNRYMNWVADEFDLHDDIVFDIEVDSMAWDEAAQVWEISASGPDGARTWRANAVISAVGFLNRPTFPIFRGPRASPARSCTRRSGPKATTSAASASA